MRVGVFLMLMTMLAQPPGGEAQQRVATATAIQAATRARLGELTTIALDPTVGTAAQAWAQFLETRISHAVREDSA
ncbi:MAG TPA: hypothetical protein VFG86_10310 [Chloroflexota bacterium]|nr:hypothetical protein [Chloroflexota bacterium]